MNGASGTLVLFDVDGTLLNAGGVSLACLAKAFARVTERSFPAEIAAHGKTDPLIVREAFRSIGLAKREWVEAEQKILRKYPRYLSESIEQLRAESQLLEGVIPLLKQLRQRGVPLGLLTGNLELAARKKLDVFALNEFFPVGGFGSDCADRNRLGRVALERACRHYGRRFETERVWVVGDTPRDVEAARALGAKALTVATGPFRRPMLEEFLPEAAVDDFKDLSAVMRVLQQR